LATPQRKISLNALLLDYDEIRNQTA